MKKNVIAAAAAIVLILALVPLTVCAEAAGPRTYGKLLVLGDSITTGYGLGDYDWNDPYKCRSYGNRLATALGLEGEKTYYNRAENGDRTEDLLSLLPSVRDLVAQSDLIVISIGGNNLLQNISLLASAIAGKPLSGIAQAVTVLSSATPEAYLAAASSPQVASVLAASVAACGSDVRDICALIREYNPGARTIFLLQYDPSNGVPGFEAFDMVSAPLIKQINAQITSAVTAAGSGFELADVPSVIDPAAAARTNMLDYDIHPNLAGHGMIYKLLIQQLGLVDPDECEHEFGEWIEISEGQATEPWTGERTCRICGYTETSEFPARETSAPETAAAPGTDPAAETKKQGDDRKWLPGCKNSGASAFAAAVIPAAALLLVRRKKHRD